MSKRRWGFVNFGIVAFYLSVGALYAMRCGIDGWSAFSCAFAGGVTLIIAMQDIILG